MQPFFSLVPAKTASLAVKKKQQQAEESPMGSLKNNERTIHDVICYWVIWVWLRVWLKCS
jgi:hypothetical protein